MERFIELRYGLGDLGKSICNREDVEDGELFVQWELIPISAIKNAFIVLPQKRNIEIVYEIDGRLHRRTEYYKNTIDCIKRWVMIRRACGITSKELLNNPVALPMDAEKIDKGEKKQ